MDNGIRVQRGIDVANPIGRDRSRVVVNGCDVELGAVVRGKRAKCVEAFEFKALLEKADEPEIQPAIA